MLSRTFNNFFESEKSGGILLIVCTLVSLLLANSALGSAYLDFWHAKLGGLSLEHWINDGLMAVFFLFVGLELERELYNGELSNFRKALLPIFAAIGGICVPALIHFSLNAGSPTQAGSGIPMATDIAFALGILALLGSRIPAFRRASSPVESTPELRVRVRMWMIQFEHAVFHLAYGPTTADTEALLRFTVSEMRRFIVEEAG